eukprot:3379299-Rhodomonas_salina.2
MCVVCVCVRWALLRERQHLCAALPLHAAGTRDQAHSTQHTHTRTAHAPGSRDTHRRECNVKQTEAAGRAGAGGEQELGDEEERLLAPSAAMDLELAPIPPKP